jgi:hypothetical protein
MKKRFLLIFIVSLFTWINLYADDKPADEKKLSYTIGLDIGSTYTWRGSDTYVHKLDAANTPNSVFNFAPGLFPSITVEANSGLSFNIWGARSLLARTLKDGELNAYDEIDFTGTYTIEDKSGIFSSSLIGYMFPTPSYATGITIAYPSYAEMVFSYTAPVILSPFVSIAGSLGPTGGEYEYASIGISHEIKAGILKITPKLLLGYWYFNKDSSANKVHVDLNVPFLFELSEKLEVHAVLTGCYRLIGFTDDINKYSPFILAAAIGTSFKF